MTPVAKGQLGATIERLWEGCSRTLGHLDGTAGVHVHPAIRHPWPPFFIAKVQMPFSLCGASFTLVVKVVPSPTVVRVSSERDRPTP